MNRRDFLRRSGALAGATLVGIPSVSVSQAPGIGDSIRPGDPEWPMAWVSYDEVESLEADIADLKAHGVGLMEVDAGDVSEARALLNVARETGMKLSAGGIGDITEHRDVVEERGFEATPARMIGGVYSGKAIDRHVFSFSAESHRITIEPPVYNKGLPYTRHSGGTGPMADTEPIGHYYPDMGDPVKAEVVVPLRPFDGQQHLKVVPARVEEAPPDATPANDTVTDDLPESSELRNRTLYQLSFDLSGLDGAMLDRVGLAVYWEYGGTDQYWFFGNGNVSPFADSTRQALRQWVRDELSIWSEANGGSFPSDVVLASRCGDEAFLVSGHLNGPAVNYPLWDYSAPGLQAFRDRAGAIEPPRTWGFPEIYGRRAYGEWLYTLHEGCAELCGVARDEMHREAPELLVMRNMTRMGVFHRANEHDGTGLELLTDHLDAVHLDPYPVNADGYQEEVIARDMSYCAGLARRYDRPLIPWLQAHTYGGADGLQHPAPDHIHRMCRQHRRHGVDAIVWLGYGDTFPNARPESWAAAGECHERLQEDPPTPPTAQLAVLRSYDQRALLSDQDGALRNPADWLLQQFLYVWAVRYGRPYDVFEAPPSSLSDSRRSDLEHTLADYRYLVATADWPDAWVLGKDTEGQTVSPSAGQSYRDRYEQALQSKGWL